MAHISRFYKDLGSILRPNKVTLIYGPRQIGKTTLITDFLAKTTLRYRFDSGDNLSVHEVLSSQDFNKIKDYVADYELIVIDEAQKIPHIGQALKIMVDQIPNIKIIATGSSSFELAGQVGEPLTGRKFTYKLFPVAQMELKSMFSPFELKEKLEEYLIFGAYPEAITRANNTDRKEYLEELVDSYLLKDVIELERIKSAKLLRDLLRLLAFQIGNEVSLTELATQIGLDYKTVGRYLDLLEKAFVIYNLRGFSKNLRKEITKKSKYYFYDNGVRNAIISNFNSLNLRNDQGALWENFLIMERLKMRAYNKIFANDFFWRTWDQHEIDLIEERDGKLFGFEFKYNPTRTPGAPKDWTQAYPNSEFMVITPQNYLEFIS